MLRRFVGIKIDPAFIEKNVNKRNLGTTNLRTYNYISLNYMIFSIPWSILKLKSAHLLSSASRNKTISDLGKHESFRGKPEEVQS
jgi:hypothetical protein